MDCDGIDDILRTFYEESREHLDGIEGDLLAIERVGDKADDALVNKVFRAIHTIKGGCGFFGLSKLGELTHAMENVLHRVREREMTPDSAMVNILLKGVDAINSMIGDPQCTEGLDTASIIAGLKGIMSGSLTRDERDSASQTVDIRLPDGRILFSLSRYDFDRARMENKGGTQIYLIEYDLIHDIERKGKTPWDVIAELLQLVSFIDSKVDIESVGDLSEGVGVRGIPFYALIATVLEPDLLKEFLGLAETKVHCVSSTGDFMDFAKNTPFLSHLPVKAPPELSQERAADEAPRKSDEGALPADMRRPGGEASSIRVSVGLLDKLMTFAEELVLARNQLVQSAGNRNVEDVAKTTQRIDFVTAELQEAIMATRMQMVGVVFHRFQRMVRDLAHDLGKEVNLELKGEDVELDKSIIEAIGDPLTHLVRNAMDHGIETPAARRAAGKPLAGSLRIGASHEGGYVVITISDDGAGINPEKVRAKAQAMGLYSRDQLDAMPDKEVINLIFLPGFSTAEKVTGISGRGVGMDVVNTNLSRVGGTIDLQSALGAGSTIKLKLPLTLAIIPSLLVAVGEERYAIPQVNLLELVRIPPGDRARRIEAIGEAQVMRLRSRLLPLVDLAAVLGVPAAARAGADNQDAPMNIAVVSAGDIHYGLVVDKLLDSYEIVVKPLGRHLKSCGAYSGATILGDGSVSLILDVAGLAHVAKLSSMPEDGGAKGSESELDMGRDKQTLLLVRNGGDELFGVSLGLVLRIEKMKRSSIEVVGGKKTVKYRDGILPLCSIEDVAEVNPRTDSETIVVLVYKASGREVGLMLSEVVDIVETTATVDDATHRQPGIMGSMVIGDRITLILDLYAIVYGVMPHWLGERRKSLGAARDGRRGTPTIMVAEDSPFFMAQLKGILAEAGYEVLAAPDGAAAFDMLSANPETPDMLLTDIEMPNLDGVALTKKVRAVDRFKDLPIVAVTTVAGDEAERRGRGAGIDEYLLKLDKEQILATCERLLAHGRTTSPCCGDIR